MKKFAILAFVLLGTTFGGIQIANGQQADLQSTEVQPEFRTGNLSSMIDDIEVPYDVLEYVQLTYDGHAVTKAERVVRNGEQLYKLRVDRDDQLTDYNSIALLFTMDWKLIGTERAATPPPPPIAKPEVPKPENENPERPRDEDKPEQQRNQSGGRGGGDSTEPKPEPKPDPKPAPDKPDVEDDTEDDS